MNRNYHLINRKMFMLPGKPLLSRLALIIPVAGLMFLASCSNNAPESDADAIRNEIAEHQKQIMESTMKVNELERQLEAMGEQPANRSLTAVEVMELQPQSFNHFFRVNAAVEAVQEAIISPEISGQLTQIAVTKGQRVSAGQVVAKLNTSVIENSIEEIKTSLQLAKTVYERQKGLWDQEIGSEIQYLEAKNNYDAMQTRQKTLESQLDMAVMRAPFNGIVDEIFLKEGELAIPGVPVMQIINLGRVYINADIAESFLPMINTKADVILRFPTFPDFEAKVPIHRLGNVINPENRTFQLQLRIDNPGEKFKPNMVASVNIQTFTSDSTLVLPSILIKQDVQGHFVYIAQQADNGDLNARKKYIERGLESEGLTMIKSGLEPGTRVIQRGHNQVGDGTLISIE
ncbi:MAG: efflux RND transporter periplasmic adaptor subunit [Bacteroidales bacterium]|nr:efflux RND transporter periplasmic adaptor subunit [Bacteroidales bacterium]